MTLPSPLDAFAREPCGCPREGWRYLYRCLEHAALDGRARLPAPSAAVGGQWYADNCCPFCWRVNPYGLACSYVERCDLCGVVSCNSHGQATYRLGVICPRNINPRTKVGRAFLSALAQIGRNL